MYKNIQKTLFETRTTEKRFIIKGKKTATSSLGNTTKRNMQLYRWKKAINNKLRKYISRRLEMNRANKITTNGSFNANFVMAD